MKIKELFNIEYGQHEYTNKSNLEIGDVPVISSKSTNNGVHGYYNVKSKYKNVVSVPRTGSICEATYQGKNCCVDDNCLVLTPKNKEISQRFMFWAVLLIRREKWRYFYGRQVTPTRLGELEIPNPPDWVETIQLPEYPKVIIPKNELIDTSSWKDFKLIDLFELERGKLGTSPNIEGEATPFITASSINNGISCYTGNTKPQFKEGKITVSNDGSPGDAFYQSLPFDCNSATTVLTPKFEITPTIALFICTLIRKEKFKYSYGRKWGLERMKLSIIKLPVKDDKPNWEWIEEFMSQMPYLDLLEEK